MASPSVVVVGGGIAGLTVAHRLARLNPQLSVKVLEQSPRAGGVIGTLQAAGRLVELGPNGFLDSKPEIVQLCDELGLSTELERARPESAERFVLIGRRLRRAPKSPGEFLKSDVLSLLGKLRFLWERFSGKTAAGEDESIANFGRRHFGSEATETLIDAVVTGIYAGDIEKLSVRSCFPKLVELEGRFGSLLKAQGALARERRRERRSGGLGTLTAPRGGMARLVERLQESISEGIEFGTAVECIERAPNGWRVVADGRARDVDAVVVATPANAAATLLAEVNSALAAELGGIQSAPAIVVALAYRRDELPAIPVGFGYLAPERLGRPVLGIIYSSNIFENQTSADEFMVRAILGGDRRRDAVDWTDEQLVQAVRDDLKQFLGVAAVPTFQFVRRWPHAIPQYHVGHAARLARIDEYLGGLPGLFLTGASYRGVAVADCVKDGMAVAERVAQYVEGTAVREG